jgi:hypothetical protein
LVGVAALILEVAVFQAGQAVAQVKVPMFLLLAALALPDKVTRVETVETTGKNQTRIDSPVVAAVREVLVLVAVRNQTAA